MQAWRDQPFHWPEAPAEIGVDKETPDGAEQSDDDGDHNAGRAGGAAEAQHIEWRRAAKAAANHVQRMGSGVD